MKVVVSQPVSVIVAPLQWGSNEVCISVGGSGMMKYPFNLPVIPGFTTPEAGPDSHAPGLKSTGGESIAGVEKLPSLNCSTIVIPLGWVNTVKCRLNRSSAQSFPQVPESVEPLAY